MALWADPSLGVVCFGFGGLFVVCFAFGLVVGRPCHHLFTSYISYEDYKSEWIGHLTSFRYAVPLVLLLLTLSWLRTASILEIRRSLRAKKRLLGGPTEFCLHLPTSYLKLQDVDYISELALRIASSVAGGKQKSGSGRLLGKCLDLSKACKQMGVLPEHRYLSVIFCHDAEGQPRFYVSNSLMFGATFAVYSFNRVSRSLWFLLIECYSYRVVHSMTTSMFSPEELAGDADQSASELLDLLEWKHVRTGPKGKPFESCFNVLGCSLKLNRLETGKVVLENKERLERVFAQLDEIRTAKRMTLHQAQVLHGLLRYSCGFFAGKHMQQVCVEILQLGKSVTLQSRGRLEEFCRYAADCLESCKPRKIHAGGDLRPILIFSDASWEFQVGGLGAVVIDTAGGRVSIYCGQIGDSLKNHWMKEIGDHLICQLELYVMVSLRWSLRNLFHNRRTI